MRSVGRYELWQRIASGGMGAVHLGCVRGEAGFRRAVAIKAMHASMTSDANLVAAFIDEARLAARLRHPNIVSTLDVACENDELILVMEYVHGESFARLLTSSGGVVPIGIIIAVMIGSLRGLHAAHEARGDGGVLLDLVHRDVSPQNIIVGVDGVARVADFGVAKATGRINSTSSEGALKGKLAYMAPEQVSALAVDRRTDVFAAGVVLWEALAGERLFQSESEAATISAVLKKKIPAPSTERREVSPALDRIVLTALEREPDRRFASAREMANALEELHLAATTDTVGEWVAAIAERGLEDRATMISKIEKAEDSSESLGELAQKLAAGSGSSDGTRTLPATPRAGAPAIEVTREESIAANVETIVETPRRSRALIVLGAAALVTLGAFGIWRAYRFGADSAPTTAPAASAPAFTPTASITAADPVPEPIASDPAPPRSPSPSPSPSLAPSPPPLIASAPTRPAPKVKPRGKHPAPNCAEPYTYDELGRRIYKRECLTE